MREDLIRHCPLIPTRYPPGQVLPPAGLLRIARQFPLAVVASEEHYLCIVHFRLYYWLQKGLAITIKVPADVYSRLSRKAIEDFIVTDLLIAPVLYGLSPGDVRPLAETWDRLQHSELFCEMFVPSAPVALGKLRGTKTRRTKSHG